MNKKLVGLALAVAMMFGVASMASAAVKFKFGAWMRYRGVLTVEVGGEPVPIGYAVAARIWVQDEQ